MPKVLTPNFKAMSLAMKRSFVLEQIESHRGGGLLVFSKTY